MKSSRRYFDKRKGSPLNRNYVSGPIDYIHQFQNIQLGDLPHTQTLMVDFFFYVFVLYFVLFSHLSTFTCKHIRSFYISLHFRKSAYKNFVFAKPKYFLHLSNLYFFGVLYFSVRDFSGLVVMFWNPYLDRRL